MSVGLSLDNALTGLRMAQLSLDRVSHNIANAQTPGYTRKVLGQETLIVDGIGAGVRATGVQRYVDADLQREMWRANGETVGLETKEIFLRRVEELHGRPEAASSIAGLIGKLKNAFDELATTHESKPLQDKTVLVARDLASEFNRLSEAIQRMRNDVQDRISQSVDTINEKVVLIDEINQSIKKEMAHKRSPAEFEDRRDQALKELAEEIDISYIRQGDGTLLIATRTGQPALIDPAPTTLHFAKTTVGTSSFYERGNALSTINPIRLKDPGTGTDVTPQLTGGRLGALIELRDTILPRFQSQLDELAYRITERFDGQDLRLFTDSDGVNLPPDEVGFAGRIRVGNAVLADSGKVVTGTVLPPANSNDLVLDVITYTFGLESAPGVAHTPFSTTNLGPANNVGTGLPSVASLLDHAEALVAAETTDRATVSQRLSDRRMFRDSMEQRFTDHSGVDIDTEMSLMIILQRSYSASAQVLRTTQSMLDDLLNSVR